MFTAFVNVGLNQKISNWVDDTILYECDQNYGKLINL